MFNLLVIIALVHNVSAAVYFKSHCPDIIAVENFDMSAYGRGKWYEIARYPNDMQKRGNCSYTTITYENGRYKYKATEIMDGSVVVMRGHYELAPYAGTSGILHVHSPTTTAEVSNYSFPVHYIYVDYDTFAVIYECIYNEETQTRQDYAWIMSRSPTLSKKSKIDLVNVIQSTSYLDIDKLAWDEFTEDSCYIKY